MKRIMLVLLCLPFLLAGGPNEPPEFIKDNATRRVIDGAFETIRSMRDSTDAAYRLADSAMDSANVGLALADSTRALLDWYIGDYIRFDYGDIRVIADTHFCTVGQAQDYYSFPDTFATGFVFTQIGIINAVVNFEERIDSTYVNKAGSTNKVLLIRHPAYVGKWVTVSILSIGGKP